MGLSEKTSPSARTGLDRRSAPGRASARPASALAALELAVLERRRAMVAVVAREKQLEKRLAAAGWEAEQVEREARHVLDAGDEHRARQIVVRKILVLRSRDQLAAELEATHVAALELLAEMREVQRRADSARRSPSRPWRRDRDARPDSD
jgi:phage shock protein A